MDFNIPPTHPRYHSLLFREKIVEGMHSKVVTPNGLFAHGRGESLDYFIGEETRDFGRAGIRAAALTLCLARKPVISVNGNVAALCPRELVELAQACDGVLEVNLFYRAPGREEAIEKVLKEAGAKKVLGVGETGSTVIPELFSDRRIVSPEGIFQADAVFVPLEDGDRTEALVAMGKKVVTVDLNPLSRTAKKSTVTIVDNVVRCMPLLVQACLEVKKMDRKTAEAELAAYDNKALLGQALEYMGHRLLALAAEGL